MFYIRNAETGFLLSGIGASAAYYGKKVPQWTGQRDFKLARRFTSIENAERYVKTTGLINCEIVSQFGKCYIDTDGRMRIR